MERKKRTGYKWKGRNESLVETEESTGYKWNGRDDRPGRNGRKDRLLEERNAWPV